jgi:hypothetical protein
MEKQEGDHFFCPIFFIFSSFLQAKSKGSSSSSSFRRNISGKSPFKTALFVGCYIIVSSLDWSGFWICCSSRCYINSERLRSKTNTPTRNCTSRTIGLQFSGQSGIVLISGDLTVGCMLILDMLF